MTDPQTGVLILCPTDTQQQRSVAGLTVGERLLLSLAHGGVNKVAFVGDGERPVCDRARLEEVPVEELKSLDTLFVVTTDLVFDRGLIKDFTATSEHPLVAVSFDELLAIASEPDAHLAATASRVVAAVPGYGMRVLDDASAKVANKALFKSLIKPMDGFISRNINRKFSTTITRALIHTPLTPNQLTLFAIVLGIMSGVFAYFAEYWWSLLLAGLLFQTQSMLDGCDGEIARLKYQFSVRGQWLDSVSDDITNYAFFLGLGLGQARVLEWEWLFWFTWGAYVVQHYCSLLMYQRIYKMGTGDLLAIPNMVTGGESTGLWGRVSRIIHVMTKRDFFVFITSILAAIGLPLVSLFLIAGGSFIMAPSLTLNEMRIRRAIREGTLAI